MNNIMTNLKKHTPTLLCVVATGGVALTAVLAAKETPKAIALLDEVKSAKGEELTTKEAILTVVPTYIPAVISGVLTVACIFGANTLNKRQQASLASAYALLNDSYMRYKKKVIEHCGKDTHEQIMKELSVKKAEEKYIYVPGVFSESTSLVFEGADEEERLFYDSFSERYFTSTISQVLQAEHHLNRNAIMGCRPSLNDFYDLLGLEHTDTGDNLCWDLYDMYYWIDFNHIRTDIDDVPCWIIECAGLCYPQPVEEE